MEKTNYLQIIRTKWLSLLIISLLASAIGFGASLLFPRYYQAQTELYIVQKESQLLDSYAAQKAAEKLGTNLSKLVLSLDFQNKVIATGMVDANLFDQDLAKRKKQWEKTISAQVVPETGIIRITGYGLDQKTAVSIAGAAATVLTENIKEYYGGEGVTIKVIDNPIASNYPVRPNLLINTLAGLAIGFVGTLLFHIMRKEFRDIKMEKQDLLFQDEIGDQAKIIETESQKDGNLFINKYEIIKEKPVEYQILDHQTFPEYKGYNISDNGPITMYDHMR